MHNKGNILKKEEIVKLIKYVTGSMAAVLTAEAMGLAFAYSAGIITLLTIQDTKKETVKIAGKRILLFLIMTVLSVLIFPVADFHVWAFGLVMIPCLYCGMAFHMKEAMVSAAVLCTHYISVKSCAPSAIGNEFMLLLTGAGIGTVLNLFMPDGTKALNRYRQTVDDQMVHILKRMALYIRKEDKSDYTGSCFDELDVMLEDLKKEAVAYSNNHFIKVNDEYYNYMQLREKQCIVLKRVYADIVRISTQPVQVIPLAGLIRHVADGFSKEASAYGNEKLLKELDTLHASYAAAELPKNREEFESRAMLYHILEDMRVFLMYNGCDEARVLDRAL